jgi:hypothetical protein
LRLFAEPLALLLTAVLRSRAGAVRWFIEIGCALAYFGVPLTGLYLLTRWGTRERGRPDWANPPKDAIKPEDVPERGADFVQRVQEKWNRAFPFVKKIDRRGRKLAFVLVDSVAPSRTPLSNAYGFVRPTLLSRLVVISALLYREGFVPAVVIHHHPALHHSLWSGGPPGNRRLSTILADLFKEPAMIIENSVLDRSERRQHLTDAYLRVAASVNGASVGAQTLQFG